MKAKTRFLKMFYKLPKETRRKLEMISLDTYFDLERVCREVRNDTGLGKEMLKALGYEDD